jgi:Hemerythrin HHE cation binding domain
MLMLRFVLGAIVGGVVMLRWRREIETYIGRLVDARHVGHGQGHRDTAGKASEMASGDAAESGQGGNRNAIAFLKEQHEEAQRGFQGIERGRPEERGSLWAALRPKLKLHEQLEETHVYGPAAQDARVTDRLASWPARHQEEVREAERLMDTVDRQPAGEDEWMRSVERLRTALERHIQEEESQIWPAIARVWDERRLDEVGAALQKAHPEARAREGRR